MQVERHIRLFRNGRSQAVRIPREFEFDAEAVVMRREGNALILQAAAPQGLLATLAHLPALSANEALADWDEGLPALGDVAL
jgi:antitoxin VapB